ncbi:hypothetical protein SPHG1_14 [Salmonella phage SPHG1]|uniref:Uncharacterized protein n=1 Tax=Salmonella phage vB_SenM-1 TaxID=2732255 RepID=A0A6M4BCJ7_9CAUD|nr:hypothetical protein vBSenM1_24 [Salmonella phage vB_SenM-1]QQO39135.1 hypothetical protein SPHG1_14 [Salmonella phage SPHG1]
MKQYIRRVHNLSELAEGDRVLIATPYSTAIIGYVESTTEMADGNVCAYVDTRWRKRRKLVNKWYDDKSGILASHKFKLAFNHDTVFVTNMKLNKALARVGIKQYKPEPLEIPF